MSVFASAQFKRTGTHLRKSLEMLHAVEDPPDKPFCRNRIIQGNVVGDLVELLQRRIGPDYSSHRAIRFFASA
jgi:hypothetical protein